VDALELAAARESSGSGEVPDLYSKSAQHDVEVPAERSLYVVTRSG